MNISELLSSAAVSSSPSSILSMETSDDSDFLIRESSRISSGRVKVLSLGRVLNILLDAEPRELEKVRGQLKSSSRPKSSVGKAALSLMDHVLDMHSSGSSVEQIFVPVLEHAVKSKEHSNRKRSVCILQSALESDEVGVIAASSLATIIATQEFNNRVKLGWCVIVREVVQGWSGQRSPYSPLHKEIFAILVSCVQSLTNVVCVASVKEDGKSVPTRLSIAAADCILAITKVLAVGTNSEPEDNPTESIDTGHQRKPLITPIETIPNDVRNAHVAPDDVNNTPSTSSRDLFCTSERRNMALWEQLDNLVSLVNVLCEWNHRSRPLFAKGLQRVQKRLQSLASYRDSLQHQGPDMGDVSIGAEVLVACWQHYSGLLMTEDKALHNRPHPVLQHWLGALQYYLEETEKSDTEEDTRKSQELRAYALACVALTLGRLDARRLEAILEEFEPQLLNLLFSQLRGGDNTIVELAVGILRAILFRQTVSAPASGAGSSVSRLETVVPMLMEMLDTRDTAARAVVLLLAEYFAANPEATEVESLFSRLDAEESSQRRNALDVVTELVSICTRKADMINSNFSQTIAMHLFKRLGDTELTNRAEASALFASLDPSFTLPTLVKLLYSSDGRVRSAASASVLSILIHKPGRRVIEELLDCVTKLMKQHPINTENSDGGAVGGTNNSDGSTPDVERVMRLVPDWASKVEDWNDIIPFLLKKTFDEPSNAVMPRFLSSISRELAENTDILYPLLLKKLQQQSQLTEAVTSKVGEDNSWSMANHLFERLSPLLVLRVLPLSAFNDISCKELYGGLTSVLVDVRNAGCRPLHSNTAECITDHLLNRACGGSEFEDVRRVASEITGRLVPDIMLPLVTVQLEDATRCQDSRTVKACLLALCTTLVIRSKEVVNHSLMGHIRKILSSILLWPCVVEDKAFSEVAKAQHGCIDCLAWMICAETQSLKEVLVAEESSAFSTAGVESYAGEEHKTEKLSSKVETSRPLLQIVEESSLAEDLHEEPESKPSLIKEGIQLIQKLPETEQLRRTAFPRKEVSQLSREITKAEMAKRELSNKRILVLDRLTELEQQTEDRSGDPDYASDSSDSLEDVPELERNYQLAKEKGRKENHEIPAKSNLLLEELPNLEQREQRGKETSPQGVARQGFQPKLLIEEISSSDSRGRKLLKGANVNDNQHAVLVDVVDCLTGHSKKLPWSTLDGDGLGGATRVNGIAPISFRICMANVLISACQKVPSAARTIVAAKMIPPVATFIQMSGDSKMKAACLQVLFTAVYHLKAHAVMPFASLLMTISIGAVQCRGLLEERMGGAKLLASLLASEEVMVRELATHLLDAQVALSSISRIDSSPELRMLCEKLLSCLSVPGDGDV
ncbi:hypothetical protein MPTK1_4g19310 [Marchantia polymorpha subsp. ruderalis]|uniref:Uncharacterized protein n=2 Tax=Marchantia polymorpha TaxID=3197 RepID=A0AAF6BBJ6_MARPO|nr:hypothetical protein MARPO_0169s0013 [Marchantia polymorpha]BBN09380.1 hypothetical protein Mp_4g19310 [Marchantia polymorpha subsp. ruderalis]|eukprot:PTQ28249.1 hypothetical protein MARPO_0169s0013 [Marchantia polymorpha]